MLLRDFQTIVAAGRKPGGFSLLESSENYNWEDRICITKTDDFWEVFYFERGNKIHLKRFWVESQAVDYLIELGQRAELI